MVKQELRSVGVSLVILNLFLAIFKTLAWIHTDSLAVFSEAANSWLDTIYSSLILLGIYISTKDPTEQYPEGYRRIEPFISILIGLGVVITSIVIFSSASQSIFSGESSAISDISAISVLIFSGLTKYIMYRYCIKVYRNTNSPIIRAVGIDNRNDIFTVIIALIGVLSVSYVANIDAYSALIIAVAILYSGLTIIKENAEYVMGKTVSDDLKEQIKSSALENENVQGLHDVKIHYSGPHIDISMHLEVNGGITIEQGHQIENDVIERIQNDCSVPINEINLHTDPKSLKEWKD